MTKCLKVKKMGIPVFILGESGQGKSTSMRDLDPSSTLQIQAIHKALPFRNNWKHITRDDKSGSIMVCDKPKSICEAIIKAPSIGRDVVVVDDFQYIMANEFMRRSSEKGFDKFTEMAKGVWDIVNAAANSNCIVYLLSHTSTDDRGVTRCKTVGKLLDEKITLEGMATIVLKAVKRDGQHLFTTQTDGFDTVKSPMGMFESNAIDNNLSLVTKAIKDYYAI